VGYHEHGHGHGHGYGRWIERASERVQRPGPSETSSVQGVGLFEMIGEFRERGDVLGIGISISISISI